MAARRCSRSRRSIRDTREFERGSGQARHGRGPGGDDGGPDAELAADLRALDGGAPDRRRRRVPRPQRRRGLARRRRSARGDGLAGAGRRAGVERPAVDRLVGLAVMEVGLELVDPSWAGGAAAAAQLGRGRPAGRPRPGGRRAAARSSCRRPAATMPTGTEERMVRAIEMIELALAHGLALHDLYVDPLVIPIGVDAEAGAPTSRRSASCGRATDRTCTSPAACRTCRSGCRPAG